MSKKNFFSKPRVHDYNGDLKQKWYVEYSCPDPKQGGKMKRKKEYKGLHKIKEVTLRKLKAQELCNELYDRLLSGYNPWIDGNDNFVYVDQLDIVHVSSRMGKKQMDFNSFSFYASQHIAWVEKNRAKKTLETYRSKTRIFRDWLVLKDLNGYNVTYITNKEIVEFWEWMMDERNTHRNTLSKYEQILRTIFDLAVKDNIESTPTTALFHCLS